MLALWVLGVPACSGANPLTMGGADLLPVLEADAGGPDAGGPAFVDGDGDGLDDLAEKAWARDYLPFVSHSPTDGCAVGGLVARVSPHGKNGKLLQIVYSYLYDQDCGFGGHPGDNEAFGLTVDPSKPAPAGIVAMKAISHQGTACERISECGRCAGLAACETLPRGGVAWPALWPSRGKHGGYVNRSKSCTLFGTCADACEDNATPTVPELVNVGEPGKPLVTNLSAQGFISAQNGWKNVQLYDYDPWSGAKFGNAGKVAEDLVDPLFVTAACE
jgi:hypothetical protein